MFLVSVHSFFKWIITFDTHIKSKLSVNGTLSEWFYVRRGCRQGDTISPFFSFILYVEM